MLRFLNIFYSVDQKQNKTGHCHYCSMCEENVKKPFLPNLYWQILHFYFVRDFKSEEKRSNKKIFFSPQTLGGNIFKILNQYRVLWKQFYLYKVKSILRLTTPTCYSVKHFLRKMFSIYFVSTTFIRKSSHYLMICNLPSQTLTVFFSDKQRTCTWRAPSVLKMPLRAAQTERQVGGRFCSLSFNEPGSRARTGPACS